MILQKQNHTKITPNKKHKNILPNMIIKTESGTLIVKNQTKNSKIDTDNRYQNRLYPKINVGFFKYK